MNGKGLQKLPFDPRDYSHHENFGTLEASQISIPDFTVYDSFVYTVQSGDTLSALAIRFGSTINDLLSANISISNPNRIFVGQNLNIPGRVPVITNQVALDFCTAYTTVGIQYAMRGEQFDPLYQMAKIMQIIGNFTQEGADLRSACLSVLKFGSLPIENAPYPYTGAPTDKTQEFLADWNNYPIALDSLAKKNEDLSFFTIDGPGDFFDNLVSCLYMHRQERQAATVGLVWHDEWTEVAGGIIPATMPTSTGGGHDMEWIGKKTINGTEYIVAQQTWGPNAGDKGFYYFPRAIVNQIFVQGYGAYIFSRFDRTGITGDSMFGSIISAIKNLF